jgi:2-keto-4-pentenoate hydratase
VAESARECERGGAYRGGEAVGVEAVGPSGDGDGGDGVAVGVEHGGGDAGDAAGGFLVFLGDAGAADGVEFGAQEAGGDHGAGGAAFEAGGDDGGQAFGRAEGEQGLADAGAVGGHAAAEAGGDVGAAADGEFLDVDDVGAVGDGEVDGLAGGLEQVGQERCGDLEEVALAGYELAELEQAQAQAPGAGVGALDDAPFGQLAEEAVGGGFGDGGAAAQLGEAEFAVAGAERGEQGERSPNHGERRTVPLYGMHGSIVAVWRCESPAMTSASTIDAGVRAAAERLLQAQRTRTPCPPVRDLLADTSVATAYAVQELRTRARVADGGRVVGRKIGLTSPAVQAQLGVDQPDFGVLFEDMACPQNRPIDRGRLLQPRIEAEIAFVLAADLAPDRDGEVDVAAARAAVGEVVPALEIVDSRIAGWDITFVDTVADNASSGLYVLGDSAGPLGDRDLTTVEMTMHRGDGTVASSGSGAACLGDPVNALVWLARTAVELGEPLRAGDVVLSGALGPMVPVAPGDAFTAELSGLGTVRVSFT